MVLDGEVVALRKGRRDFGDVRVLVVQGLLPAVGDDGVGEAERHGPTKEVFQDGASVGPAEDAPKP